MKEITLITGSTLGNAEYVAEHLASLLEQSNFIVKLLHGPNLEDLPLNGIWLVITSTHGAGELPDNLQPLYKQIHNQKPDLSQIRFGAIGLGSREYDNFCAGIQLMVDLLTQQRALQIGKCLEIDVIEHLIPEDPAEVWLADWLANP